MNIEAKPGRYVLITITDSGNGIPAEIINKIFEPFFTTKEIGKGTGLGLSTTLSIVKSHGGFINVYSEVGKGTKFAIYLPAAEMAQKEQVEGRLVELPVGHGELVLVVDDEMAIREITRRTLEVYDYRVITASDGTEALALCSKNKGNIKVVIMDMMMPHLDGTRTSQALEKLDPGIRIISTSGLKTRDTALVGVGSNVKTFISKPYTAEQLLVVIAEVLKGKG
jgi:CheY-like chemotaxis protein